MLISSDDSDESDGDETFADPAGGANWKFAEAAGKAETLERRITGPDCIWKFGTGRLDELDASLEKYDVGKGPLSTFSGIGSSPVMQVDAEAEDNDPHGVEPWTPEVMVILQSACTLTKYA